MFLGKLHHKTLLPDNLSQLTIKGNPSISHSGPLLHSLSIKRLFCPGSLLEAHRCCLALLEHLSLLCLPLLFLFDIKINIIFKNIFYFEIY